MNKIDPKVAIIVVCWNNQKLLKECFDSVRAQTHTNHKVIMVDNGSADTSVHFTKENYPEVQVIEAGKNHGFAKGNNIGIEKALEDSTTKYVVLLNTDARLHPQWLETLVAFAEKKPRGACFQSTTLDYYNHDIIDSTHIYVAHNAQATQGSFRKAHVRELGPKKVFGVNAAACLISRAFIDTQPFKKLFDETMFMYLEDVDVAVRVNILGWDNYLVGNTEAYHMGSASSVDNSKFSLYLTFRNNLGVILKNYPLLLMLKMWPRAVLGDIDTFRHLRRTGKPELSWVIVKARLVGLLYAPIFLLKRIKFIGKRKSHNRSLWQLMERGY